MARLKEELSLIQKQMDDTKSSRFHSTALELAKRLDTVVKDAEVFSNAKALTELMQRLLDKLNKKDNTDEGRYCHLHGGLNNDCVCDLQSQQSRHRRVRP